VREAKDEEERQAVDLEEARFQALQRRDAIDKAKTQQYYQTDRVKGFHVSFINILYVLALKPRVYFCFKIAPWDMLLRQSKHIAMSITLRLHYNAVLYNVVSAWLPNIFPVYSV